MERWRRAKDLFEAALEKPEAERAAFLDAACAGDASLRQEVTLLLGAHADAGSFLDRPASVPPAGGADAVPEGGSIGSYRVLRELGRGGMGVVYLAERADGTFEKRVAIKLIRQGLDSDEIVRRFHAERQILAHLEHPAIARLLDGGNTEDGAPYFVVEHVEGEPIDRYCDARQLSVEDRLRLFREVCSAVHFAHRNLVVHRDLKPGNILVTAEGVVKLLDFGIAKLLDPDLSLRTVASTRLGSRPMTPDYASPEQVEAKPITTATDVYALGLLLYELLTGHRAYRLESYTPQKLEEMVCRRSPERPSVGILREETFSGADGTRVTLTPEAVSRTRGRDAKSLSRRLSGDLDTIVMMALRKEPERRYASVEQLSEDVRRHLAGLPVTARPDTFRYRAGKFVRRHKLGVAAMAGFVVLVLAFGVAMALQQRQVARERDRAEENAARMARERDKAQQTKDFLVELFEVSDPGESRGNSVTAREILDRGARRIESELGSQPEVRTDLMITMGKVYRSLGLYEAARTLLEKALEERRRSFGEESEETAEALSELGWLRWASGDYAASERLYLEALAMGRKLLGGEHLDVARSLNGLGLVYQLKGEHAKAEPAFREVLAVRRKLLGDEHPAVAESFNNLALVLKAEGRFAEAEPLYREALAMRRRLFGDDHLAVGESLNNLALMFQAKGDYAAARPLFRKALATFRKVLGDEHPEVAKALNNLGSFLQAQGDYRGAEPLLREAVTRLREVFGDSNPLVPQCMSNLALVLTIEGKYGEAEPLYREALAMTRELVGDEHPNVAFIQLGLAVLLRDKGVREAAEPLFRESVALFRKLFGDEHALVATALSNFAEMLRLDGRPEEAEAAAREALRICEAALPPGHVRTAAARSILGASLADSGRFEEAEPLLLESYPVIRDAQGKAGAASRKALGYLVGLYEAWGKPERAAEYRTEALSAIDSDPSSESGAETRPER